MNLLQVLEAIATRIDDLTRSERTRIKAINARMVCCETTVADEDFAAYLYRRVGF